MIMMEVVVMIFDDIHSSVMETDAWVVSSPAYCRLQNGCVYT